VTLIHLRSETTSFVAVTDGDALPVVLHWGPRLPDGLSEAELVAATTPVVPHSHPDVPLVRRLLPMPVDGWRMRPALIGSAPDGTRFAPRFTAASVTSDESSLVVDAMDAETGLQIEATYRLHPDGLLEMAAEIRNLGAGDFRIDACELSVPLPMDAIEVLDLSGRWCRERSPQRLTIPMGAWMREGRTGRTEHSGPLALCVGDPGFGFRHGRVWAVHHAWSGDSRVYAERNPEGKAQLGAGELIGPSEVVLGEGEVYRAPTVFAAYSDRGLDGISAAFHGYVRSRPSHPSTPPSGAPQHLGGGLF
jgi:alpha-galactosidase